MTDLPIRDRIKELPKRPGRPYATRSTTAIDTIVIHHSGVPPGADNALAFARYHTGDESAGGLGWPGIGYHFVVNQDGSVDKTNAITTISWQASGANTRSIGICLAGNFDAHRPPGAQWEAAVELCRGIREGMPSVKRVIGHREVPGTHKSCPGTSFDMDTFRRLVFG